MSNSRIPPQFGARRFLSWNDQQKEKHGGRVQKVSIDAGFTCPNRDGSKGVGGCTYCNNSGFTPSYLREERDITRQIETGLEFFTRRYPNTKYFVAYFQAYSNTYAPLEKLRALYETALAHPQIDGLVIGTRPDCVPDDVLDYLAEIAQNKIVELEFGLESCDDATLARVLQAANQAASVGFSQPWNFLLTRDLERRKRLHSHVTAERLKVPDIIDPRETRFLLNEWLDDAWRLLPEQLGVKSRTIRI